MATTPSPDALDIASVDSGKRAQPSPSWREKAFNMAVWILFTCLWAVFFATLVFSQGALDDTWHRLRDLPLVIQGVVWLLFLPLTAGLAIWHTAWPFAVRLVLVVGLAWINVYLFYPWRKEPSTAYPIHERTSS